MLSAGTVGGVNFKCDLFQMNVDIFITCHQFPRESQRVESWGCQTGQKSANRATFAAVGALQFGFGAWLALGYFLNHWSPLGYILEIKIGLLFASVWRHDFQKIWQP